MTPEQSVLSRYDYSVRVALPTRRRMMETTIDTVAPQRLAMVAQMLAARGFNNTMKGAEYVRN